MYQENWAGSLEIKCSQISNQSWRAWWSCHQKTVPCCLQLKVENEVPACDTGLGRKARVVGRQELAQTERNGQEGSHSTRVGWIRMESSEWWAKSRANLNVSNIKVSFKQTLTIGSAAYDGRLSRTTYSQLWKLTRLATIRGDFFKKNDWI